MGEEGRTQDDFHCNFWTEKGPLSEHRVQGCSTKPIHDDGKKSKLHIYPNLTVANDLLVVHTCIPIIWTWVIVGRGLKVQPTRRHFTNTILGYLNNSQVPHNS